MSRCRDNIKNELAYFYKVIKNMVRRLVLPAADKANSTNRKKEIRRNAKRFKPSSAAIFLTEKGITLDNQK